jgi:hypothetical protein
MGFLLVVMILNTNGNWKPATVEGITFNPFPGFALTARFPVTHCYSYIQNALLALSAVKGAPT